MGHLIACWRLHRAMHSPRLATLRDQARHQCAMCFVGFPDLSQHDAEEVIEITVLARFTLRCLASTLNVSHLESWRTTRGWLDFPEDVGSNFPRRACLFMEATGCGRNGKCHLLKKASGFNASWLAQVMRRPQLLAQLAFLSGRTFIFLGWPIFRCARNREGKVASRAYQGPLP